MDCAQTGSDRTSEINMIEMVKFLEEGAICMSSEDYKRQKNAIEQACVQLGNACTFETKQAIKEVDTRVSSLQSRVKGKQ